MRTLLTLTIALLVATAGCIQSEGAGGDLATQDPSPTDGNQTSETPSGDPSANETEPTPNAAPTANLTADTKNGSAPLVVNFTLDGSDDDGDDLSWTLDLGDGNFTDGTGLPAIVEHNFTTAGNYTVRLDVTDGTDADSATLTVTVIEAATGVAYCHRPDAIAIGDFWLDDRGDPVGTGLITGDGTWVYEESNGVEGLQVGGADEIDKYQDCPYPDTLII